MVSFVQGLYRRAGDGDSGTRKNVCQGLIKVLESSPEVVTADMNAIIQFMLKCTEGEDPIVALEACEFWLVLAEQDNLFDNLSPYLPEYVNCPYLFYLAAAY
jgi:hypothetical protein